MNICNVVLDVCASGQAELLLERRGCEARRMQKWLAAPIASDEADERSDVGFDLEGSELATAASSEIASNSARNNHDVSCDLGAFHLMTTRRPHNWRSAIKAASWVHIDEIRTLLELHYGELKRKLSSKLCLSGLEA